MEKKSFDVLPPLLRGCTYDGEKGNIVISYTGKAQDWKRINVSSEDVLLLPPLKLPEETQKAVQQFDEWKSVYSRNPSLVIHSEKNVYALGRTYDEAEKKLNMFIETGKIEAAENDQDIRGYSRDQVVKGKTCIVTGGAQGFGAEITKELVSMGAFVVVADMNFEGAQVFCGELNKASGKTAALPVKVNVGDEDSVQSMISGIVEKTGGIDLFISNAGVLKAGSVKEMALKDFTLVTSVNYTGFFLCTKHAAPVMAFQNIPRKNYFTDIIQINSKSGLQGSNKNGAYAGGKFGGLGLVQSFAMELIEDNIKVNGVCPGNFFEGPLWSNPEKGLFVQYLRAGKVPGAQTIEDVKAFYEKKVPMGRGCNGRDVVKAIYYIVEQKYETGQAVPVTGGQVMLK